MRILLLGFAPAVAWARNFLEAAIASHDDAASIVSGGTHGELEQPPEVLAFDDVPTPAGLAALLVEPLAALVLVDHRPFPAGPPPAIAGAASAPVVMDAVRDEARRAVAALAVACCAPRTLHLNRTDADAWPRALAGLLGELLRRTVSPTAMVAESHSAAAIVAAVPSEETQLSLPVPALLSNYLIPLFEAAALFATGAVGATPGRPLSLIWPRECFLDGDSPGAPLPATVEIAGRARILAYGPYLPLPIGSWTATAWLGFSADIGRIPFILEIDTGETVTRGFFEVERGGIFKLQLEFRVAAPLIPIEVRLISQDATLEGLASLIEVQLVQVEF